MSALTILVAEVWRRNLDYTKNLQAKYFTGKNIPIYGSILEVGRATLLNHGLIQSSKYKLEFVLEDRRQASHMAAAQ